MKLSLFSLVALLALTISGQAQSDEVYKAIAKETCECIGKKNYDYNTTSKMEIQATLGLCMMESAQRNKLEFDMNSLEDMTKLGEKVGMQMAPICPEVFKAFMDDAIQDIETDESMEEEETEYFTVTGKVKSVEEKDFVYVTLKDASGKEHKFAWFFYFEGSDEFKANPKSMIGKDVTITYILLEVLQPKTKTYYNLNILSGLQKN